MEMNQYNYSSYNGKDFDQWNVESANATNFGAVAMTLWSAALI